MKPNKNDSKRQEESYKSTNPKNTRENGVTFFQMLVSKR